MRSFRAQLKAIHRWGRQQPADLASLHQPVLAINGESDKMVPTNNTVDLDRRLPNSQLVLYPDAGHGGCSSSTRPRSSGRARVSLKTPAPPHTLDGPDLRISSAAQPTCWASCLEPPERRRS